MNGDDIHALRAKLQPEQEAMVALAEATLLSQMAAKRVSEATGKAEALRRERDAFCMGVEKKYGIPPGTKWSVNFERGIIKCS